jgi:sequestosome 1
MTKMEKPMFNHFRPPHWKKFGHGMKHSASFNGRGCGLGGGAGPRCPFRQQQAPTTTTATNPLQQTLNDFMPYIQSSMPIVNDPEQLKNVGEYLKSFLNPFGIDVDYYVDSITKNNEAKKKEETTASSSTSNEAKKMDVVVEEEKKDKEETKTSTTTTTSSNQFSMNSPFQNAAEALHKVMHANAMQQHAAAFSTAPVVSVVKEEEKKTEEASPVAPEDNDFNLVDIEKELKVIKAIEQLKAMGYNDENGWLTRLVSSKEGNINAVLDTLIPNTGHKTQ